MNLYHNVLKRLRMLEYKYEIKEELYVKIVNYRKGDKDLGQYVFTHDDRLIEFNKFFDLF